MESLEMQTEVPPRLRSKILVPAVFLGLPAIAFYAILIRQAINIPLDDDYEALLNFLNHLTELKNPPARISYFLAAQFNEYKIFFGHAVAWLQFALLGHTDLKALYAIGNGFVLLLAILLWMMFLPNHKSLAHRMALFIPVSYLLFQLGYSGTLNWAMPALQNLPVLVFSFGTIYLLMLGTRQAFCGALIGLVLAIAASGNGFLAIPIGVIILTLSRRYARVLSWLIISAGCVAAYAYRYNLMSSQSRPYHSVLETVLKPRPIYVICFMGNAAAFPSLLGRHRPLEVIFGLSLGLLLCSYFFVLVRRGYPRRNPTVSYCVLFLMLTAVGVAGIRSQIAISQSLDSRYTIYGVLFLIFAWFAFAEEVLQHQDLPLRRNPIFLAAGVGALLFCLVMDLWGWRDLEERNRRLIAGMAAFEHSVSTDSVVGPILPFPNQNAGLAEVQRRAAWILKQSMRLGIYQPPIF